MSLLQDVQDVFVPYSALNTVGIPPSTLSKLTELLLLLLLLPDVPQEILATTEFIEVHGRQGWSWS